MSDDSEKKKRGRKISFWIKVVLPVLSLGIGATYGAFNYWAGRTVIPAALMAPPLEWQEAAQIRVAKPQSDTQAHSVTRITPAEPMPTKTSSAQTTASLLAEQLALRFADSSSETQAWLILTRGIDNRPPDARADRRWDPWQGWTSLSSESLAWIRNHHALAEMSLAFEEQAQLPPRKANQSPSTLSKEMTWLRTNHEVLFAEMLRRRMDGDLPGARCIAESMLMFTAMLDRQPERYFGIENFFEYTHWLLPLEWMVEHDALNDRARHTLRQLLTDWRRPRFGEQADEEKVREILDRALKDRQEIIRILNSDWTSESYYHNGWGRADEEGYVAKVNLPLLHFDLPRWDRMLVDSLNAMRLATAIKHDGKNILSQFDQGVSRILHYPRMSYPEMLARYLSEFGPSDFKMDDKTPYYLKRFAWISMYTLSHKARQCRDEAQINLLLAALEVREGRRPPAGLAGADLRHDRQNLWRDTFSEKGLQFSDDTTTTLIYSLGPDLADQQGREVCPWESRPMIGIAQALIGDLVIRVPH